MGVGQRAGATLDGVDASRRGACVAAALFAVVVVGTVPGRSVQALPPGEIEIVSVSSSGRGGDRPSSGPASNASGGVVAFYSDATNLVAGDSNHVRDVFVRVRDGDLTERVSVSSAGVQANRASHAVGGAPGLSADGELVAFYSLATNLVPEDTNGQADVFVRDRGAGTTEVASVSSGGALGNGPSVLPALSGDGRFVAFQSLATNLVDDDTNGVADIFVRDRQEGATERVCGMQPNRGSSSPAISGDGRFVAFASAATNLVAGDINDKIDVFVCDRNTGTLEIVSVNDAGVPGDGDSILPAISGDGRIVAFKSLADNLVEGDLNGVVDVFARNREASTTEMISASFRGANANDFSFPPSVSDDGRFVAFGSFANNLVAGEADIVANMYVRDRNIGRTLYVDVNAEGKLANNGVPDIPPGVSGDGREIAFASTASNLTANDRNSVQDVFAAVNPFYGPDSCPDGICPPGLVCVGGFCVAPTATPTPTKTGTPTVTPTPTPTLTPTPTFVPCTSDDDCPPGQHCRGGFCKDIRDCESFEACYPREACLEEECECGGDCNVNGIVLGNEVTRAILILGGAAELSTCPAADIDGGGTVTAEEVTQAATNMSIGCSQEGVPLVVGLDRAVTFSVSSASGEAGGPVALSIELGGSDGTVVSAQADLLFDPHLLDIGDPASSCAIDPRLAGRVFAATLPAAPAAPPGLRRLRLFVSDIEMPMEGIADGRIATCTFNVRETVGDVTSVVGLDNLTVGDATGRRFGTQAVSGSLSIAAPTTAPGRPVCAGDCDGDGEVFVTEITRVVLIMSGHAPLSQCPAADVDGDGEVFVTEVTRAVVNLGAGCPQ